MENMIVKRECDAPMARQKNLLPCDNDCKCCMACIETTDVGERRHCNRHKKTNIEVDAKIAMGGVLNESWRNNELCEKRRVKPWTDEETEKIFLLKGQGLTWVEVADRMGRTMASVHNRYKYVMRNGKEKEWID